MSRLVKIGFINAMDFYAQTYFPFLLPINGYSNRCVFYATEFRYLVAHSNSTSYLYVLNSVNNFNGSWLSNTEQEIYTKKKN